MTWAPLPQPTIRSAASQAGTFRERREAAEMGTRDDEYDYLFKGRIQDSKFSSHVFSTCHHTCPTKLFEPQNMAIASDQVPHRTANLFFWSNYTLLWQLYCLDTSIIIMKPCKWGEILKKVLTLFLVLFENNLFTSCPDRRLRCGQVQPVVPLHKERVQLGVEIHHRGRVCH